MTSRYAEFKPTALDSHINLPDREDWLVAPVSQTRDSDTLTRANFDAALFQLGGESETVEVHRFGHWGPGWFEIILVDPSDAERVGELESIGEALDNYPVLDDELFSEMESEDESESWDAWGRSEFIDAVREWLASYPHSCDVFDASDEATEELAEYCRQHSPYWCEHHSDGPRFDLDYVRRVPAGVYAEIVRKYR